MLDSGAGTGMGFVFLVVGRLTFLDAVCCRATQNVISATASPVTNPFGTLPAMPQITIGRSAGSGPSVQYGISSMPVRWDFQILVHKQWFL